MTDAKYDIFISWAHADREEDILQIKRKITENYKRFAPDAEELKIFTDHAIEMGDDWAVKIQDALKNSDLFIAMLSPNYFKSDYCAHEMHMWKQNEIIKGILNKASLPVYYIELEENPFETENKAIKEAFIQQSNEKLKPWFTEGQTKLYEEEIKKRIASEITAEKINDKLTKIQNSKTSYTNTPKPNRDFVGRVSELTGIRLRYAEMPDRIPLLHGAAGVGKTELAFAYAWAYASEYPGGRYVIKSEGIKTIPEAFAKLLDDSGVSEELGINTDTLTDEEKRNPEMLLRDRIRPAILKKAGQPRGRVLIILDNIDDPYATFNTADIDKYLRWRNDETIHILATTRKDTLKTNENEPACPYSINDMVEHDALELLRNKKAFSTEDEKQAAKEIIEYIGGNAWALSMIAESLKQNGRYSYRRKADSLKQLKNVEYIREKDTRVKTRHGAIDTEELLQPTLDLLTEEERSIAGYASLLHPDYVYMEWLKELFMQEYEQGEEPEDAEDDWLDVKEKLEQMHIISKTDETGCARMHRLTGYVLERGLKDNNKWNMLCKLYEQMLSNILYIMEKYKDGSRVCDMTIRIKKEEVAAVLKTVSKWIDMKYDTEICSKIVSEPAFLDVVEKYKPGSREYLELLARVSETYKETSNTVGLENTLYPYAKMLLNSGNYTNAYNVYKEYIQCSETLGLDDSCILKAIRELAICCLHLGHNDEALTILTELFEKECKIYGKDSRYSLTTLDMVAQVYANVGQTEDALKLRLDIAEKMQQIYGDDDVDMLCVKCNIATMYKECGKYREASEIYENALNIYNRKLDDNDVSVLSVTESLAETYIELQKYEEAYRIFKKVFEIQVESYGYKHNRTSCILDSMVQTMFFYLDKKEEAIDFYKKQINEFINVLGDSDLRILNMKCNLAQYYASLNNNESKIAAENLYVVSIEKLKDILSYEPQNIGLRQYITIEMQNFSYFYRKLGRIKEAQKVLLEIEELNAMQEKQ